MSFVAGGSRARAGARHWPAGARLRRRRRRRRAVAAAALPAPLTLLLNNYFNTYSLPTDDLHFDYFDYTRRLISSQHLPTCFLITASVVLLVLAGTTLHKQLLLFQNDF